MEGVSARLRQPVSRARISLNRHLFARVHGSQLIYNTCWEDPRLDREAMALDPTSRVLMITSAGCNALDYLLDDPAAIDCVDLNPRQNALLELKVAALRVLEHDDFFQLFGRGWHSRFPGLYHGRLRPLLSRSAQRFWDEAGSAFLPDGRRRSFYYHGTSGTVAWAVTRMLRVRPHLRQALDALLDSRSPEAQRYWFGIIEEALWNEPFKWVCRRNATLSMLGVPQAQRALVEQTGGLVDFMQQSLRRVFLDLPVADNYFWRVYLTGSYTRSCCPNYLRPEHFDTLRDRVDRLRIHTRSLGDHMRLHDNEWSHFVLLDHQDWLAHEAPDQLVDEWVQLLSHATPRATWLLRTGGHHIDFLPSFVHSRVAFSAADDLHARDRVGTYGRFFVGRRAARPDA
ncbi:MAG: DUF3419 family protein [Deltaproteobacteria bacterium]|nr:MAG: DUF3419 family protein [Deltaproteobacteria bacterium]